MSSPIYSALSDLSACVDRLDRALAARPPLRTGTEPDLFSHAGSPPSRPAVVTSLNGKVIDAARMARAVDRAIEKVELLLREG